MDTETPMTIRGHGPPVDIKGCPYASCPALSPVMRDRSRVLCPVAQSCPDPRGALRPLPERAGTQASPRRTSLETKTECWCQQKRFQDKMPLTQEAAGGGVGVRGPPAWFPGCPLGRWL